MTRILFFSLALVACSAATEPTNAPISRVGAILGQSNAMGMGTDLARPVVSGTRWRGHTETPSTGEVVDQDWGDLRTRPGGRFGAEFGVVESAGTGIVLEKYAVGATPLAPSGANPAWLPSAGELYPRALAFLAAYAPPDFVLWWQGESDADDLKRATSYGENLTALSTALREDLGAPDLIFIAVRIRAGLSAPYSYAPQERAGLDAWKSDINRVIDVDDLPVTGLHYQNDALDEVGRRAWAAFKK